ncbi:MAG: hypothetical protein GW906_00105 [Epsilonproteobacteria bacterium]|nr:hypothetical protein [Campylobacterota bacterium]OIO17860.1 MAG: hypothetical protein AUJ81_00885 [Helicobacteraceae bacterium CG1_02_36_14]PIP10028.1 MAG: hypothetical protein COX50_07895 [Sulfurimonas sp. CG23_combo_of_CG06-09_8_20_14_all_36_33]PIS25833.1 MAG: hypothetical protein COT46_04670 [Sulfurimonas sp. CG08_land_8_20_14_0_20_36_33]PIU35718.1 MAG: hypothetical protein COT05_02140 [Sulfurimonas sp. CG07_land_8_20_14_0_80_36_56]PIV05324.1 MAG: hypothetical protein COS56_01780 [Sulfur
MKAILFLSLCTFLLGDSALIDGLERASHRYKRDACEMAKTMARKNYDVKEMNVGCNCEKSDNKEWMCFVRFKYSPKEAVVKN